MKLFWKWIATISWAALIWYLTSIPQLVISQESWFQTLVMSGAHFFFFGVQAVLLLRSRFSRFDSLLLTSLYGLVIEANQLTIPGRSADLLDWLLDTLGALAFLFLLKKYRYRGL